MGSALAPLTLLTQGAQLCDDVLALLETVELHYHLHKSSLCRQGPDTALRPGPRRVPGPLLKRGWASNLTIGHSALSQALSGRSMLPGGSPASLASVRDLLPSRTELLEGPRSSSFSPSAAWAAGSGASHCSLDPRLQAGSARRALRLVANSCLRCAGARCSGHARDRGRRPHQAAAERRVPAGPAADGHRGARAAGADFGALLGGLPAQQPAALPRPAGPAVSHAACCLEDVHRLCGGPAQRPPAVPRPPACARPPCTLRSPPQDAAAAAGARPAQLRTDWCMHRTTDRCCWLLGPALLAAVVQGQALPASPSAPLGHRQALQFGLPSWGCCAGEGACERLQGWWLYGAASTLAEQGTAGRQEAQEVLPLEPWTLKNLNPYSCEGPVCAGLGAVAGLHSASVRMPSACLTPPGARSCAGVTRAAGTRTEAKCWPAAPPQGRVPAKPHRVQPLHTLKLVARS